MSNDSKNTSSDGGDLDLSSLNFGPAWARDDKESKSLKKFKDRSEREDSRRGGNRRGGGWNQSGGGHGERRDHRGGGGSKFNKGKGRGGRFDERRPKREEVEPPAGVTLKLMPIEESLDLLAKEITQTGRTYSVFDLAKVLLQGRERFRATFESSEGKFFRCREDNSLWLTKGEALLQLWRGDWIQKFYTEVKVEGKAPSGSFQAVAKCGLSGQILGPPNYHGYQTKIAALHRERFGNMDLDHYKSKIKVEHGEEAVAAWLESMKTVTQWKVSPPEEEVSPPAGEKEAPAEAKAESQIEAAEEPSIVAESTTEEAPEAIEPEAEAEVAEPAEIEDPKPEKEVEESPVTASEEGALFETSRDVEQHFLEHHFEKVFEENNRAWVTGDIKGALLSPGLLTLLKRTVQEEKRYPSGLMPIVCRQLSGRHVAVFKWKKKLKVGPSRPHAVNDVTSLSERPQAIIKYLADHSGKKLSELWDKVLPKDASDELKHEWYHDLHWLLNQGHAILLNDTSLHLAKVAQLEQQPQKKVAKKEAPKKSPEESKVKPEPESEPPAGEAKE